MIVGERAGKVLGFASYCYKPEQTEIDEIDVSRKFQRQGIGRTLVQYIEAVARRRKRTRIVTSTLVNALGRPWKVHGFWLHMGFMEAGETLTSHGTRYVGLVKHLQ